MHLTISWLGVLLAALSSFLVGGIWYGPLFGKRWQIEAGLSDEDMKRGKLPVIFGVSFLLNIVAAGLFAVFIGPKPGLLRAVEAGAAIGLGLVATSFWISYLFARRSLLLGLIDGGYMTLRFVVYGLVIALVS